ncbi:stabilin-2-like [Culicoides brevitarsis]|uniref:stabilin-2-like n=1 Tax=Culicoides brevitarsis TaxID=469753 RepID=UPI00307C452C
MKVSIIRLSNYKCITLLSILSAIIRQSAASVYANATCSQVFCGINSVCVPRGSSACECLCPYQFQHQPNYGCFPPQCRTNDDCRRDQSCKNGKCVSLCVGACGVNARCELTPQRTISCQCYFGYIGDASVFCYPAPPSDLCRSRCGNNPNTDCRILHGVPHCFCKSGFVKNINGDCIHECEVDSQCPDFHFCSNYRCLPVCKICDKAGADCIGYDGLHSAECQCPKNYRGNPYKRCEPECYVDEECPFNKPFCQNGRCFDPCLVSCGKNANCFVKDKKVACVCPPGTEGNPMFRCDPKQRRDPCNPSPCGENAFCEIGTTCNGVCAICTCPRGFKGDPNRKCVVGTCNNDSECFYNQACIDYQCIDLCKPPGICGKNANCTTRAHKTVCSCPEGFSGDPAQECTSLSVIPLY